MTTESSLDYINPAVGMALWEAHYWLDSVTEQCATMADDSFYAAELDRIRRETEELTNKLHRLRALIGN